ncbi:hypothetical protein ACJX0J_041248, partial [Zea mays]
MHSNNFIELQHMFMCFSHLSKKICNATGNRACRLEGLGQGQLMTLLPSYLHLKKDKGMSLIVKVWDLSMNPAIAYLLHLVQIQETLETIKQYEILLLGKLNTYGVRKKSIMYLF